MEKNIGDNMGEHFWVTLEIITLEKNIGDNMGVNIGDNFGANLGDNFGDNGFKHFYVVSLCI